MSVIFGFVDKNKVYLAADNRLSDSPGKIISDNTIKIEVINKNVAVSFAGNYSLQEYFLKSYRNFPNYEEWLVEDLEKNIGGMCTWLKSMNEDWAKTALKSIGCFIIAGKSKTNIVRLSTVKVENGDTSYENRPVILYNPIDSDFNECGNILAKNIKFYYNEFASRTIKDISKISKVVSPKGNLWVFDLKSDAGRLISI